MKFIFSLAFILSLSAITNSAFAETRPVVGQERWICVFTTEFNSGGDWVIVHQKVFLEYNPYVDKDTPQWKRTKVNSNMRCSSKEEQRKQIFEKRNGNYYYKGSNAVVYAESKPKSNPSDTKELTKPLAVNVAATKILLQDLRPLDTFTRSSLPENSWGNESEVIVGGWGDTYHGFIRFDITGLPPLGPSQRLVLKLYNKARASGNSTPAPIRVQRLETAVSNETSWAQRIMTYTKNQQDYQTIEYNSWVSIEITEYYRAWKAGAFNHGIALIPLATDNRFNFFISTENNDDPALQPFLEFY